MNKVYVIQVDCIIFIIQTKYMTNLNFPQTAALIAKGKFNMMELEGAICNDAVDLTGRSIAFLFIEERKAGRPLTDQEKQTALFALNVAARDARREIFNAIYFMVPANVHQLGMWKNWINKGF